MNELQRMGFTIVLLAFFPFLTVSLADPPLPTPIGRVVWVKGSLKAIMPNKEERSLQKMSVIYLHDTLTTDANSQAQIAFTDASLMTFYPNTKFYIDQYAYKPAKKKSIGKSVMNLLEGGFRTITGAIAKNNPSNYQVNTPVATIGVRGTDYAAFVRNQQSYIGYYTGTPCITSKNKVNSTLCLNASTKYALVPKADVSPIVLSQQPDVFNVKLEVVPFKISPFQTPSSGPAKQNGGAVSNFCISEK